MTVPEHAPTGHPVVHYERIGVLIMNLGTPSGTDYRSMRRYLAEFLSDRRVIDVPRILWWFILNVLILPRRPFTSGAKYRRIWNQEKDESPLMTMTRSQAEGVAHHFFRERADIDIAWAMRYGEPAIGEVLTQLKDRGCQRILLFPLYPQYAASTSATACDAVFRVLMTMRWQPALRVAPPYHDNPLYIQALEAAVQRHVALLREPPEVIVASFHGLPKRYLELGDPYHCHCQKTARLLRERLGFDNNSLHVAFQSRFGREPWLKPYCDELVYRLAKDHGVRRLAVIAPGFAADCLETLEEIEDEIRTAFLSGGGKDFSYIPCLNDSQDHLSMLAALIKCELAGWI